MANLNGQNIGTNYKGIINIGSTINQNVSASLQSLTDGDGNNLPIQVSTTQAIIGGGSSAGRLVVRGDGTNPVLRIEGNTGANAISVSSSGALSTLSFGTSEGVIQTGPVGFEIFSGTSRGNGAINLSNTTITFSHGGVTKSNTSGSLSLVTYSAIYGAASGNANFFIQNIAYTVNNTGAVTGSVTGIFLNATETNLNGTTHNLMNLQVGGVSRFRIRGNGQVNMANLPTSSAGLSAGDLWNNGGVLNIV